MRLVVLTLVVLAAQAPPRPTAPRLPPDAPAAVTIIAEDERTGAPLEGVVVSLRSVDLPRRTVTANTFATGAVQFSGLPPGSYTVSAFSAEASVPMNPWVTAAGFTRSLVLAAGDSPVLRFTFRKAAVISGQVVTPEGKPVRGATVEVVTSGARPRGGPWIAPGGRPGWATDAEGRFQLRGLPPGSYLVRARLDGGAALNFVYAPGTTSVADATVVTVESGDEVTIGITAHAVPAVAVRGVVVDTQGKPVEAVEVVLRALQNRGADVGSGLATTLWLTSANQPVTIRSDAAGRFEIRSVLRGIYALQAIARSTGPQPSIVAAGALELEVRTDTIDGLVVRVIPAARLTGQMLFNGEEIPDPARSQVGVRSEGEDAILRNGIATWTGWRADGTFEVAGIIGTNRLTHGSSGGWFVERATLEDGTDIVNAPFTFAPGKLYANVRVWLSDRAGEIAGPLPDDWSTRPPSGIIVFPDDASLWSDMRYVKHGTISDTTTTSTTTRRFSVKGLPAARGYLVAVYPLQDRHLEGGAPLPPDLLEKLAPDAMRVFLAEAGPLEVILPAAPRR